MESEIDLAEESNDKIVDLALQEQADIENERLRDAMIRLVEEYVEVNRNSRKNNDHMKGYLDGIVRAGNELFKDDIPNECIVEREENLYRWHTWASLGRGRTTRTEPED